jgi:hypothetical protein
MCFSFQWQERHGILIGYVHEHFFLKTEKDIEFFMEHASFTL